MSFDSRAKLWRLGLEELGPSGFFRGDHSCLRFWITAKCLHGTVLAMYIQSTSHLQLCLIYTKHTGNLHTNAHRDLVERNRSETLWIVYIGTMESGRSVG